MERAGVAVAVEGLPDVLRCRTDGCSSAGTPVLVMATKIQFNWFVRSSKVNTQGTSMLPGYWQSNVFIGEEGRTYLMNKYGHRLGGDLSLHSIEIEE